MKDSIERAEMPEGSAPILENRSIESDYSTLLRLLKPGLKVLDVGCGTGTMTADVARMVGQEGSVIGLDSSEPLIARGRDLYFEKVNLELIAADLFTYLPPYQFDLIISARVLQWLDNPEQAVNRMMSWLKPGGILSVLDYDHTAIEFSPSPPESMLFFYEQFLKWRADAGMNNSIANDLPAYFKNSGLSHISSYNANQVYTEDLSDFSFKAGIWADVAASRGKQLVKDGYLDENDRLKAIDEYREWVNNQAESMTMKLKEVRGIRV